MTEIYEYKTINISLEPRPDGEDGIRRATIETAANRWADMGWRTVAVMPAQRSGQADAILIERKKKDAFLALVAAARPRRRPLRRDAEKGTG